MKPLRKTPGSWKIYLGQITTLFVEDMDPHLASAKDIDTVGCFLHFQDVGDIPQSGQSASSWAERCNGETKE